MPEFIPVLVAGLILFAIMFAVFGFSSGGMSGFFLAEGKSNQYNYVDLFEGKSVSMNIYPVAEINGSIDSKEKIKSFEFEADPKVFKTGVFEVLVNETNKYGKISFKINGFDVYSGYPEVGRLWVRFGPDIIKKNNVLEVAVSSPGWRFWETAKYDFTAVIKGAIESRIKKDFVLEPVKNPKLIMDFRYNRGNLAIELNGKRVYEDSPDSALFLELEPELFEGKNIIEFIPAPGARFDIAVAEIVSGK